jgi:transcriptional regulator NrdR family protein
LSKKGKKMRLIKCRKCGAAICTDETFQERMLDAIAECNNRARKDRKNANSYLQEAAAYRKILTQYLHRTAQYESSLRIERNEKSVLVAYVLQHGLVTQEKLDELYEIAKERTEANNREDAKIIEQLYGQAKNPLFNNTKADPTAREAIRTAKGG